MIANALLILCGFFFQLFLNFLKFLFNVFRFIKLTIYLVNLLKCSTFSLIRLALLNLLKCSTFFYIYGRFFKGSEIPKSG